jgi:hypothetical protein
MVGLDDLELASGLVVGLRAADSGGNSNLELPAWRPEVRPRRVSGYNGPFAGSCRVVPFVTHPVTRGGCGR